jgi:hypothetical protein
VGALLVLVVGASGCTLRQTRPPECPVGPDDDITPLVLMAQSVKQADLIPCISSYSAGWSLDRIDVEDGRARFWLDSDRGGDRALEVVLDERCDVSMATEVPSDEEGLRRFEEVRDVSGGFSARRYYRSSGSCVTYVFEFDQERASALVNEVSLMLGFVARSELREEIHDNTDGLIDNGP